MRRLAAPIALALALLAPSIADAAIPQALGVTCSVQVSGQRLCGNATSVVTPPTLALSWDGTPIDVAIAFPPVTGTDTNYPVVGMFHGWGGSKQGLLSTAAQRWLNQGYAVFSMTDRGFWASCGILLPVKPASCANGYIHLMHNAYEVRDAQYFLGKLADQGLIDPQRIGATGGSYGGGMAAQLGALKDRTQNPDGSLIQWRSPANNIAMKIAATAPEFPWTDLAEALQPNGSGLDYVANAPYLGIQGDHRFGIQKQNWTGSLFGGGLQTGFYAPFADPKANLVQWNAENSSGGPYDGHDLANQQITELPNHGAYYTDDSEPPAPALLSSGWNDDLFPVDQTVKYYNKVRSKYPDAAIKLFYLDFGHNPRAATPAATDAAKLAAAENAWFSFYVKGAGAEPAASHGGVDVITSVCPTGTAGTQYTAANWASLAPGEIRLDRPDPQTIGAPGTAPTQDFVSVTGNVKNICTTQAAGDNASAATYKSDPAPAPGYTIAGSSTVIAELDTPAANDQVIARLYDVDPLDGQKLIGRAIYRPTNVGEGFAKQVFQLHPQAWKIVAGHYVKLELLAQDSPYARNSSSQHAIRVRNLELRIPTVDAVGSAGGQVQAPAAEYLPPGYKLARAEGGTGPGAPHISAGGNPNATGVFTLAWDAATAGPDLVYTLNHRDTDDSSWSNVLAGLTTSSSDFSSGSAEGEGTWTYRVVADQPGKTPAHSGDSARIKVDKSAPAAPTVTADRPVDYAGNGGWYLKTVDVSVTDNGDPLLLDGSDGSGVDVGSIPRTVTHDTSGSHTDNVTVKDAVGNKSTATSLETRVDADPPSLSVGCPAAVLLHAAGVHATIVASDGESGLVSDPSGTPSIDTSTVGPKTTTVTATDNVGHDTTEWCTTQVQYMFGGLQQPINPDGSSIFKLGSTVPVKLTLTDAALATVGSAVGHLTLAKISDNLEGNFLEAVSTSNATTGTLFRLAGDGQYTFNLSTKGLSAGTWSLKVSLDDDTEYVTHISLR